MLVLSRKNEEEIIIGNDIRIMVISIHGNRVRLGIAAPPEVPVDRLEVRKEKERRKAEEVATS